MGENRTVKSALEEIAEAMSSSVNKTVSKTAEEIKKQRESNPGAKYARNMVAANLIGLQSGKKLEDGSWSFENPEDQLRFQVAMRSAGAARDEFHTALRARVNGKVDLLKTIYGKYNSLQDGAMISEEEQLQYRSQAKRIADSLQVVRQDLEKNKGMYSQEEYDELNSYLQEMEGYALEIGKTPVAQSAYPWIPVGAVDTDGDGKRDNFVTGGQLLWDQTRRNDENVGKALDTYNKTHDYDFRAKSKEEQNREIEGQIKEIEAIYTPQAEQQDDGVWLKTGPETGVTEPLKWTMKPVSGNEAWNLWDGLQQKLDYVLYSGTYTEKEAQRIADRVYGVKHTYDELASQELKDAVKWRYGETAEDFMKEFRYQKETGITREKIPYMSFDRLMQAAFQGDEMGKIASGYLANAGLTKGEYNRFISGAETAYKQGKITESEAKELIGQRTANGTKANVEGINNALTYLESHGTLEMSGKGFELGSKMGVEQIFEASQGSVDEMVKRASGYINEAVGGILDMMGFDVGKELADKGVEQQSYRSQKLKGSQQVQYNWMREYNNELEGVDSRIGRWFADKVPGLTASLMNMAFSSAVGGSIANGTSAFTTAFGGVKTGKGITDLNLSMGYRMVNYGIKNAGLFTMSTGATLNTYGTISEDERLNFGQKILYAMADGAAEFATEKLFGGNPLLDGEETGLFTKAVYELTDNGTFDSITKTWLECIKSGSWKALAQKAVSSGAFDMAGEGLEEVLSSTAMMAVDYALYGKTDVTCESLGNDFATGLMLSMFLTGGKNMINVFNPINENGEYKKIKYFTAEQQVDRDSMDAQLMLYAVEYLAGDTELMQKNGLTEKEAKKAKKEFSRILGEYAQATSWMDAGEGGKLNAESLVKAAKGVYGEVDASLFTPATAAEDATNVVKAWNEVLDESWSPANLVPVVSNMAKLAQAAYINLENAVTMGEVDMNSAYEIMMEVGKVRDDAMEALDAYVELRKSGKRIETAEEAAAEAVEEAAAAASEEGGEAGANAEAGRIVEQEETAAETEANNEVSKPVEQEQQWANAGKEETKTAAEGEKNGSETAITQNQPAVEEGGINNGRTEVSDEGGKRNDGMGAGEQGGGVDEGKGRPAAGRRSSRSAAVEVRRAVQAGESEKITPNALGVKGGSKKETIDILSREAVDRIDSLRAIREEAEKDGASVEFFTGKLKVFNRTKNNFSSVEGIRLENEDGSTRYLIKADGTIRSPEMIYRHEKFHDMVKKNQDMLVELRDRLLTIYKPEKVQSLIQAYIEAYHGIYGEYTENMTEDEILAMENAYMEEILADVYADIRRGSANLGAGRTVLKSQIEDMERSGRQNRAAVERKNGPGEQYSAEDEEEYKKPITVQDIEILRSIGRKSINEFTADDLKKAQKWAYKFYQDLRTKSPFFRAWFGDWRANQTSEKVRIASIPAYIATNEARKTQRGNTVNKDTGWDIRISREGETNTVSHSGSEKLSEYGLAGIRSLVENAVLLDTEIHEHHSNNAKNDLIAFDHKLYSLGKDMNGNVAVYRITVEEYFQSKSQPNEKKFHNLKYIEKVAEISADALSGEPRSGGSTMRSSTTEYSVSDLYQFVKQFDKDFTPSHEVSTEMLNSDGTPKVFYHGAKKNGGFTVFRDWQYFTEKESYAGRYAERGNPNSLYAVYLTADKVFDTRDAEARRIFNEIRQEYGLGELQDTGLPDWTDGYDITDYLEEHQELGYDAILLDEGGDLVNGEPVSRGFSLVIRDSTQIKSATDNIGTFDRNNSDIQYSVEDEVEELDEGYRRATQEETKYFKAPEQDMTIDGLNPVDVTDDMTMSDEDVRKAARREAENAEKAALADGERDGNRSEIEIRLMAKRAGTQALINKIKQTENRIAHMKFVERNGLMTEAMRGMLWRAERTFQIQNEELKSRRKEERKLRERERNERAENQKPVEAKKKLKQDLLEIYSVPAGQKDAARQLIEYQANKIIQKGTIDNQDKNELLDILFSKGMVRIGPDDYYAEVRSYLMGGRIYVPAELREEFGDDWNSFRKEAFGANVLLTNNPMDMATDVWLKDLANMFPGGFAEDMDLREGLEQIVKLANEGKAENLTLAEMIRRNQDEYGWSIEEQMEDLERRAEQALRDFANTAKLEMQLKRESAYKEIALRNKYREMIEREAKLRHDNQTRATVMEQIKRLKKMRNRTAPEIKAMIDEVLKGIDTVARSISVQGLEDLQELEIKYKETKKDENFIPNEYLEARISRLYLKRIDEMDMDEVVELGKTILGIVHSVQTRNKLLTEEREQKISEAGKAVMKEVNATEGSDGGAMFQWLVKNQLSPVRMFKMLGGWLDNGELTNLAYELERGQTKQLEYLRGAIRLFDDVVKDEKMQEWFRTASGKDARWIELSVDGKTVHITPMMRVSLYMHSLNYDNMRHISGDGIRVPDMELYKKGRISDAYAKGTRVKIDIKTMKSITAGMSSEELRFAQAMRKYFNEYSTEKINETSMILDGFERAGGKNYYHIKVDKNFLAKDMNTFVSHDLAAASVGSIVNERVQSTLPIILEDANVALEEHMNNISRYYGLAIPIRDVNAVLQYTQFSNKGEAESSVLDTIGSKWGEGATKYIQKLIADLQGGTQADGMISRTLGRLRGKLAGANLAGNPSVALSQIASYPAAIPVLGTKALIHGLNLWKKVDMDLVQKYSPLLWYRNQGNSTQELGDYMHDKTIEQKLPWLMNWIQKMDSATVRRLWAAAEYKVQEETDLRPGSKEEIDAGTDEYYRRVAELFNRAVYDTQPNYTVMQRPEALRTNNEMEKIFTMFKTVSLQTYNMMFEAAGTYKAAKKRGDAAEIKTAKTYLARTAAGIMTANVLYNAMKTFFRLARGNDDRYRNEDGEFTFWSIAGGFGLDLVEIFAGCIIGGSEIVSGLEYVVDKLAGDGKTTFKTPEMSALEWGYDTVVAGVEALNNLFDGDWRYFAGGVKQTAKQIAMAFGIPANNVESYLLTVAKWVYPEAAMEYENLFGEITKNSLAYQGNRTVNAAISVIMENRTDDLEDDAAEEIQRLWGKGFRSAVPSPVPASVTIDNENVQLTAKQQSAYKDAWNREVSDNLKWLMESAEYTEADDELRQKMIGKLYAYADAVAKSEMGIGYEAEKWVEIAKSDVPDYIAYAVVRNSIDRDKTLEENAKAIQAVIAHDAGGISEEDAQEIARLYVDKHDGLIPGEVPEIITYKDEDGNEVEIRLTSEQREIYSTSFRDCVGDQLSAMMASKEYTDADDDTRSAMIKSMWTFARQTAKEAVDENVAPEKWVADGLDLMESGVELSTYITYTKKAKELDGKGKNGDTTDGLLNSRRIDLINQQDWTSAQKEEAYRDTIDNEEKLNALKKAGLSWEQASKVLRVTGDEWNKVKTIASMGLTNNKAAMAAMVYLSDGAKEKVRVGASLGVKLSDYVEVMDNADKNKNGSVNQEEAKDYIRTMGLSPQQSAYLWQMVCSTKSAKNNPFSSTFGWEFLDRMPE